MGHYFVEDESLTHDIKKINYYYKNKKFIFTTDSGIFSKDHIDPATDILLNNIPPLNGSLLDLGCGYGCIGIMLCKTYGVNLTQADVNQAALNLAKLNCEANNVESVIINSDCFDNITDSFDTIVLNPPIHAGKNITYKMYEESYSHLKNNGQFYIVTLKKHGAESTYAKLKNIYESCEIIYKKKGYYVIRCIKKPLV